MGTRIVKPADAAKYDPPLAEYLALPIGDHCPADPGHERWGTDNPSGYLLVRRCRECNAKFRAYPSAYMLAELGRALSGIPMRLATA